MPGQGARSWVSPSRGTAPAPGPPPGAVSQNPTGEVIRVSVLRLQNLQPRTTTHAAGVMSMTSSASHCCNRPEQR